MADTFLGVPFKGSVYETLWLTFLGVPFKGRVYETLVDTFLGVPFKGRVYETLWLTLFWGFHLKTGCMRHCG